jgi:hypothetical protein
LSQGVRAPAAGVAGNQNSSARKRLRIKGGKAKVVDLRSAILGRRPPEPQFPATFWTRDTRPWTHPPSGDVPALSKFSYRAAAAALASSLVLSAGFAALASTGAAVKEGARPSWLERVVEAVGAGAKGIEQAATPQPAPPADPVQAAIQTAAAQSGVDESYLRVTAFRESSFNPTAEAATSSAAGLYQFVDDTWLEMVDRFGAENGLAYEAAQIENRGGRRVVRDRKQREAILDLRLDPKVSALLAASLTRANEERLETALGREPSHSELYAAHFMGGGGAVKLIRAAAKPRCASLFPQAARSNKPIFYAGGRERSCTEVLARLEVETSSALG